MGAGARGAGCREHCGPKPGAVCLRRGADDDETGEGLLSRCALPALSYALPSPSVPVPKPPSLPKFSRPSVPGFDLAIPMLDVVPPAPLDSPIGLAVGAEAPRRA